MVDIDDFMMSAAQFILSSPPRGVISILKVDVDPVRRPGARRTHGRRRARKGREEEELGKGEGI
jgi:hypothetical protein